MPMEHALLFERFNPEPALRQLREFPELWDENPLRTRVEDSPFAGTSDVWLRFGTDPETWGGPHFPEFYPAWNKLPALQHIVWLLTAKIRPVMLGGVMLTRIPAGGEVSPHNDGGRWHADFYNTKLYAILEANEECLNTFEDQQYVFRPGEIWLFNNRVEHAVYNRGETDRISLIICMRVER